MEIFGWDVEVIDGHSEKDFKKYLANIKLSIDGIPKAIIAKNIKGKGVSFLEGHGIWHHKVPNDEEMVKIRQELL